MTTIDRLDGWKSVGVISEAQHAMLTALVRRERFSLFVELSALLYLGVLSVVGGLVWTFRENIASLGDVAILSILALLMTLAFGYCVTRTAPYSNDEVESPTLVFDYVLYFGGLVFSATLAFIEARFGIFQGWDTHLLLAAVVFGVLAYRFDNRFVLSLALSTLAGYLGLQLAIFDGMDSDRARLVGMMYGGFLIGLGLLLDRQAIKRHFLDVYLQLGANAILLSAISGVLEPVTGLAYLAVVLTLSAASIYLGVRHRRFAFVAYGTLYGYAGLSARLLNLIGGPTLGLLYFVVTGSICRRRARDAGAKIRAGRMSLYTRDEERAIRVQRLVKDWTRSGLLLPEQRERVLPDLQVNLRRTNIFLRVTLFVFGYLIVNSLTGLFVVTLNLSEDATMFLALTVSAAFFVVAHTLVKQFRLYHFGIEESAAVASVSFGAIGLSMLLHSNFSILQALIAAAAGSFLIFRRFGLVYAGVAAAIFAGLIPFGTEQVDTVRRLAAMAIMVVVFFVARERRQDYDWDYPGDAYAVIETVSWAMLYCSPT